MLTHRAPLQSAVSARRPQCPARLIVQRNPLCIGRAPILYPPFYARPFSPRGRTCGILAASNARADLYILNARRVVRLLKLVLPARVFSVSRPVEPSPRSYVFSRRGSYLAFGLVRAEKAPGRTCLACNPRRERNLGPTPITHLGISFLPFFSMRTQLYDFSSYAYLARLFGRVIAGQETDPSEEGIVHFQCSHVFAPGRA